MKTEIKKLKAICAINNGCYFFTDEKLTDFAMKNKITVWQDRDKDQDEMLDWKSTQTRIQGRCHCQIKGQEIIFC